MNDEQLAARLRQALEQQEAGRQPGDDAWPRIERRLRRQPWRRALMAIAPAGALVAAAALAPQVWHAASRPPASPAPAFAAGRPAGAGPGWTIPGTYRRACSDEATVCKNVPAGAIPATLGRPAHFPSLRPGQACPATPGRPVRTPGFSGIALGRGPVQVIVGSTRSGARHGLAKLLRHTSAPGWYGFPTLWFSRPSYRGPFVIRLARLAGTGKVAMGDSPTQAPLVVPPGATLVSGHGYREVATGAWVKSPGCYAWQIDGLHFSEIVVVRAAFR